MCTLLNGLEGANNTLGLESMCVGGGQGMAMIVERLNRTFLNSAAARLGHFGRARSDRP